MPHHGFVTRPPVLDETTALLRALDLARRGDRAVLGITGPPGSGKSTYAAWLVNEVRVRGVGVVLVPMDGFHLAHDVLTASGEVAVKGAPHTFDAAGYVHLLGRLHAEKDETVWAPRFDRDLEDAIAGSIGVGPEISLVVTEGNYLLLESGAWSQVRELLDGCWYVDVPDDLRQARLAARHRAHGRSEAEAWERTLGSDEANARVITATRSRADAVVKPVRCERDLQRAEGNPRSEDPQSHR